MESPRQAGSSPRLGESYPRDHQRTPHRARASGIRRRACRSQYRIHMSIIQMKMHAVATLRVRISDRMIGAVTIDAEKAGVTTLDVNVADMKALLRSVASEEMPLP